MPHTSHMSNQVNLTDTLNRVIACLNGEPVEAVEKRMERVQARWTAEDEANVGEEMAERRRIHAEDDSRTRF